MQRNGSATSSQPATSRQATLTSEASLTCGPTSSPDTPNAISSPESADGRSPSVSPDGPIIDLFGQAHVPVSRSPARESVKARPTIGTFGRIGSVSSASSRLQSFLANRLRSRLGIDGSTPWPMIWRARVTPLGRPYCRLALSGRPKSVTDFGLLPTPMARRGGYNQGGEAGRKGKIRPSLETMALHNLWPTPTTVTDTGGAAFCKWGGAATRAKLRTMLRPGEFYGPLNPTFPAWLMGYPPEWLSCAPSATRSSRKSRQLSSNAQR